MRGWDVRKPASKGRPGSSGDGRPLSTGDGLQPLEEGADEKTERFAQAEWIQTTRSMTDTHGVSHLPYRDWYSACVRERGKSQPHKGIKDHSSEQVPMISMDYGFFGAPDQESSEGVRDTEMPVLVVCDRRSKCQWAHPVPEKGVGHPWVTTVVERLGTSRIRKNDLEE